MRLSAPSFLIFLVSFILGIIGILQGFGLGAAIPYYGEFVVPFVSMVNSFWLMVAAWGLLMIGNLFRGL